MGALVGVDYDQEKLHQARQGRHGTSKDKRTKRRPERREPDKDTSFAVPDPATRPLSCRNEKAAYSPSNCFQRHDSMHPNVCQKPTANTRLVPSKYCRVLRPCHWPCLTACSCVVCFPLCPLLCFYSRHLFLSSPSFPSSSPPMLSCGAFSVQIRPNPISWRPNQITRNTPRTCNYQLCLPLS